MKVGELYAELRLITSAFDQGLTSAGASLRNFGTNMAQTGRDMMLLTAPLAAVGAGAITTGMNFDTAFAKIEGLVGVTGDDLAMLRRRTLELAGQTAKSPVELADALYYLTSSGLSAAESADVLEVSAKAATAGLGKTQDVAKAVAFAMNAYRGSNLTAAQATDILTAAVKYGTAEASDLAPVLGRLLPIASDLDISYNQVAGTLAVMTRTGLDAAEASTSLSAIFSNLLKPSKAARDVLASVGLSMDELRTTAQHEPDGLIQVYRLLSQTLNDEQFSVVVPNVRALRGAMNFLAQDTGLVDEVMRGVADSAGTMDNAFGITSETAQFQLNQAMADMQVTLLELWEEIRGPVIDALKQFQEWIKNVADWFKNLSPEAKKLVIMIGGLVLALGPLLLIGGTLIKTFGGLIATFSGLAKASISVIGSIPKMVTSLMSINPVALVAVAGLAVLAVSVLGVLQAADKGREAARAYLDEWERAHGVFKDAAEVQDAVAEGAQALHEKYDPFKQDLIATGALMLPIIGDFKRMELAQGETAAITELAADAQRRLNEELQRQRQEMLNQQLDDYKKKLEDVTQAIRDQGPEYILTANDADILAKRFGVSVDAISEAAGQVASEWEDDSQRITEALMQMSPGMQLTEEKAQEMAGLLGVSVDQIKAKWLELQQATGDMGVDMSSALGDVSSKAEKSFTDFKDTATYSMDDVRARIDVLAERLRTLNEVDLATLGPSAQNNWEAAKTWTQKEMDELIAYVDSGGQDLVDMSSTDTQNITEAYRVMAGDISSALSGMKPDSEKAWKEFTKSMTKGKDDSTEQIRILEERLDYLGKVKLAELGPDALAAWITMRDNTQTQLTQIQDFVANKGTIIEGLIPGALDNSAADSAAAWDKIFHSTDTSTDEIQTDVEDTADAVGDALPDALNSANPSLNTALDRTQTNVTTTYGDISTTAGNQSEDAAGQLPTELNRSLRPLGTALDALFRTLNVIMDAIKSAMGQHGENIANAWVTRLTNRLRNARDEISSAANYATQGLQGHSPPKVGPLKEIGEWARNVARAWIVPFQDTIRTAGVLDFFNVHPALARMGASASPELVPLSGSRHGSSDSDRTNSVTIYQTIYGYTADEVERQTRRALRRDALDRRTVSMSSHGN